MELAFVSKLTAFNFIIILRIAGQSSLSLSSGGEQTCLHSSGKWVWTLQSNRLNLAQQGEDGHGSVHQGAVRWKVSVAFWEKCGWYCWQWEL